MSEPQKNIEDPSYIAGDLAEQEKASNDQPHDLKPWFRGCCIGVLVLATCFVVFILALSLNGARRASPSSRAKGTLRSLGSSQLAYQGTNKDKEYGSFKELKADWYIAEGYTLGNMIETYSMSWTIHHVTTVETEGISVGVMNAFTVIAYPWDTRPGRLYTFGVTEDQVVRVYNPRHGNKREHVKTWDPIL